MDALLKKSVVTTPKEITITTSSTEGVRKFRTKEEFLSLNYAERKQNKTGLIVSLSTVSLEDRLNIIKDIVKVMEADSIYKESAKEVQTRSEGINSVTIWDEICPVSQTSVGQMVRRLFLDASRDDIIKAREMFQGMDAKLDIEMFVKNAEVFYADMLNRKELKAALVGKRQSQVTFKGFMNIAAGLMTKSLILEEELSQLLALSVVNGTWNQTLFSSENRHLSKFKPILPKKHVIYEAHDALYRLKMSNTITIVILERVAQSDKDLLLLDKFPLKRVSKLTNETEYNALIEKVFPVDKNSNTIEKVRWLLPQLIRGGENNKFNYERFIRGKLNDSTEIENLINDCRKLALFRRSKSQSRSLIKENTKERDARPIGDTELGIGRLFLRQALDKVQGVTEKRRLGGKGKKISKRRN